MTLPIPRNHKIIGDVSGIAHGIVLSYNKLNSTRVLIGRFFVGGKSKFHVAVRLFSNRSQKTLKCGKNISETHCYRLVCYSFVLRTF